MNYNLFWFVVYRLPKVDYCSPVCSPIRDTASIWDKSLSACRDHRWSCSPVHSSLDRVFEYWYWGCKSSLSGVREDSKYTWYSKHNRILEYLHINIVKDLEARYWSSTGYPSLRSLKVERTVSQLLPDCRAFRMALQPRERVQARRSCGPLFAVWVTWVQYIVSPIGPY